MQKKIIGLMIVLLIIVSLFGCTGNQANATGSDEEIAGLITISGAWALYPMAVKWAEEFQKIYPDVQIDISAGGAGKGMADALADTVDLGMVSRKIYPDEIEKGARGIPVTKDAVVPMINENNPFIKDILSQGAKRETFINIWINGSVTDWKDVASKDNDATATEDTDIHVYTRSDSCGAAQVWAEYLGGAQEDLLGVGIYGDPGLLEAVNKDTLGIGYNNINYAYDASTKLPVKGTTIIPIDLNDNGMIDEDENFYSSIDEIVNAIAADKYPSPPARDLYFVSNGKPERKVVVEFIKWILTDGQKYVYDAGYINLPEDKIKEELLKLESE